MLHLRPSARPARSRGALVLFARILSARILSALVLFALALTAGALLAVSTPLARAAPAGGSDMRAARTRYPAIVGTRIDNCALCHVSTSDYGLDAYGRAYNGARRDFGSIESADSDGDGVSNLDEITALTFPGKADDFPSATPTGGATAVSTATATPTLTPSPVPPVDTATPTASGVPTEIPTDVPTDVPTPTTEPGKLYVYLPFASRPVAR
jgi:hypothetical protein